jgi:hypothetical protein
MMNFLKILNNKGCMIKQAELQTAAAASEFNRNKNTENQSCFIKMHKIMKKELKHKLKVL